MPLARDCVAFECLAEWEDALTLLPTARFDSGRAERRLCEVFHVAALDAFGAFSRASLAACGAATGGTQLGAGSASETSGSSATVAQPVSAATANTATTSSLPDSRIRSF